MPYPSSSECSGSHSDSSDDIEVVLSPIMKNRMSEEKQAWSEESELEEEDDMPTRKDQHGEQDASDESAPDEVEEMTTDSVKGSDKRLRESPPSPKSSKRSDDKASPMREDGLKTTPTAALTAVALEAASSHTTTPNVTPHKEASKDAPAEPTFLDIPYKAPVDIKAIKKILRQLDAPNKLLASKPFQHMDGKNI